ncbi:hypothetical protein [Sphingobacterium griseoflavum]|uniref:hypothetical protein n=1 Tax=Sphingobacterium griseoflavum TaxID=1474952 RepID=UPI0016763683|nr:hypothetical protein [Sphingobacterium griseoflavum]
MKRRLVLISMLSLGVATSSYNSERYRKVSDIDVGNPQDDLSKSADSLVFSLDHINTILDEKCK